MTLVSSYKSLPVVVRSERLERNSKRTFNIASEINSATLLVKLAPDE